MESVGVGWINLAQETDVLWAVVNIVKKKNFWFRNMEGNPRPAWKLSADREGLCFKELFNLANLIICVQHHSQSHAAALALRRLPIYMALNFSFTPFGPLLSFYYAKPDLVTFLFM